MTDPRGNETRSYFDMLGNVTKTIAAYVDGNPSDADDQTTTYTYDGIGDVTSMSAVLPDVTGSISSASESGNTVTITTAEDEKRDACD